MNNIVLRLFVFSFLLNQVYAQPVDGVGLKNVELKIRVEVVESLPWNTENGLVQKATLEGSYGSTSFASLGEGRIAFLNELENEITVYKNHKIILKFKTGISPSLGFSFTKGKFYTYGINECSIHDSEGVFIKNIKLPFEINRVRNVTEVGGDIFFVTENQTCYLYQRNEFIVRDGLPIVKGTFCKIKKLTKNHFEIEKISKGKIVERFNFYSDKNLSSLQIIGGNSSTLFLDAEFIIQEKPLEVERMIYAMEFSSGELNYIDNLTLPNSYFLSLRNDLIFSDNSIFYFLTTPSYGSVYKLQLGNSLNRNIFANEVLSTTCHYNDNFKEKIEISYGKRLEKDSVVDPISREEIIARAEAFESYSWTATDDNIWSGQICDNQKVISAPYVKVGVNRSIPYMWDGFSSLEKFDEGMKNGLSAGNINTKPNIGSMNCAEGVDCSGFVSQAWKTQWKYDTREFYPIVIEYDSWSDLKPGDIANKPGHVRLFHSWNDDGSMNMLEATSRDNVWRVVYNTYTVSEMQSIYTPCYLYSVYEETATVKNNELFNNAIKISPNPITNLFRIDVESNNLYSSLKYEIISSKGEVLIKGNVNDTPINIGKYVKGIYFIRISSNKYSVVKKIIKK